MRTLELKIPPPIVALVSALVMWCLSRLPASFEVLPVTRMLVGVTFAAAGVVLILSAGIAFRRARTTVNPL